MEKLNKDIESYIKCWKVKELEFIKANCLLEILIGWNHTTKWLMLVDKVNKWLVDIDKRKDCVNEYIWMLVRDKDIEGIELLEMWFERLNLADEDKQQVKTYLANAKHLLWNKE